MERGCVTLNSYHHQDMKTFDERTLVLIKPDGVQRRLVGEIIQRFERAGLKIVALKFLLPQKN